MKKLNYLFVLTIGCFLLFSCNKDDKDNNSIKIDGKDYEFTQGFYEAYGENGEFNSYDIDVYLMSEGIVVDFSMEEATGKGHILYLDFNSSNENRLMDGVYNYSEDREAFTFVYADGVLDGSASMDFEDGTEIEFNGGTIEVKNDGDETEIILDLTSDTGQSAKGSFKGELKEVF